MLRSILHCDMNNFYASVECMLDPALKKYPIAVCGSVEERHGIVLAKNYKAKAFDVKTGDAVWQAKQKCKDLVVVPPHYEEYIKYSKLARNVYERYTDQVEPYGMDECWLDISGTESLFGSPEKVANEIRETMKFELGLTISVGVSFNKIFAKLGSDMKKPDGKGYARALIEFIVNNYREQYAILQVGTGDSPLTIPFYEKCGFVRSHIISNFFIDNYDHPIYESGIQLVDMVYLQRPL